MVTIQLKGRITEAGTLEVDLPPGLPAGDVDIAVTVEELLEETTSEEEPLTEEEIANLLKTEPKSGAEIVAEIRAGLLGDGWSDVTMTGAEWVENMRLEEAKRRNLPNW